MGHILSVTDLEWFEARSVVAESTEGIGKKLTVLTECGLDGNLTTSVIVGDRKGHIYFKGHNLKAAIEAYNNLQEEEMLLKS